MSISPICASSAGCWSLRSALLVAIFFALVFHRLSVRRRTVAGISKFLIVVMMVGFYVVSALGLTTLYQSDRHAFGLAPPPTPSNCRATRPRSARANAAGDASSATRRRHRRCAESRRHMTEAEMRLQSGRLFRRRHLGRARGDGRMHSCGVVIRDPDGSVIDGMALSAAEASQSAPASHLPHRTAQERAGWSGSKSRTRTWRSHRSRLPRYRPDRRERPQRKSAVPSAGAFAAAVSLLLVAFYGIPQIADQLAPVVPQAIEQRLGNAADTQVRAMFDKGPKTRPFECGGAPVEAAGQEGLRQADGPAGKGRRA